jgi:hypothetical protein
MRRQDLLGAGVVGLLIDLLVHSGEFLLALGGFFAWNIDLILPMLTTLGGRIAPRLTWLDQDLINQLVLAAAVLYLVVLLVRISRRWNNEN